MRVIGKIRDRRERESKVFRNKYQRKRKEMLRLSRSKGLKKKKSRSYQRDQIEPPKPERA